VGSALAGSPVLAWRFSAGGDRANLHPALGSCDQPLLLVTYRLAVNGSTLPEKIRNSFSSEFSKA
jgi:hypothetical protein